MPKKSVKKSAKKSVKTVKKVTNKSGVGRPKGSGKYGCPTKLIRVPAHLVQEIVEFAMQNK
ncbi:MAG: hypothetical protein LBP87_08870 [Planctomycetaceae bacterium]|nr:hypothetical protein [Planctomycetaceae bacterium]